LRKAVDTFRTACRLHCGAFGAERTQMYPEHLYTMLHTMKETFLVHR